MRIGMVGLGKLGMPIALALSLAGHDVVGYDLDPGRMRKDRYPHRERGPDGEPSIEPLLRESRLSFASLPDLVAYAEIIFVAVQTPHAPSYEGVTRLPDRRVDFDYQHLRAAARSVGEAVAALGQRRVVAIISTVLPGTIRREVVPLLDPRVSLCYNPFFIAMGTTIRDFLEPELVLLGADDEAAASKVAELYQTLHARPVYRTSIENAELIKVAYNTYITSKICFANTLMELCHKVPGCDVDQVTGALALATDRVISTRYLRGGMGDGGACHPRDNIAMSWLAREAGLSYDWFGSLMTCRERQTDWLVDLAAEHHARKRYPHRFVGIYGRTFKAGSSLTTGSPAVLLASLLAERGFDVASYDPYVDEGPCPFERPAVYLVATQHPEFGEPTWRFPAGSVILDPWRYLPAHDGVEIVPVGVSPDAV